MSISLALKVLTDAFSRRKTHAQASSRDHRPKNEDVTIDVSNVSLIEIVEIVPTVDLCYFSEIEMHD